MHIGRQQENILCVGNILQNRERKTLPLCIYQEPTNLHFNLTNFIALLAFLNQVTAKHIIQITFMNPKYVDKIPIWQKDALFHKLIKNLIIVLLERCICKNNTLEAG